MKTKQLLFTGAVAGGAAKFMGGVSWKTALIIGGIAILGAAVADNVIPE